MLDPNKGRGMYRGGKMLAEVPTSPFPPQISCVNRAWGYALFLDFYGILFPKEPANNQRCLVTFFKSVFLLRVITLISPSRPGSIKSGALGLSHPVTRGRLPAAACDFRVVSGLVTIMMRTWLSSYPVPHAGISCLL